MDRPSLGHIPSPRSDHVQGSGFHKKTAVRSHYTAWGIGGEGGLLIQSKQNNRCLLCSSSTEIWGHQASSHHLLLSRGDRLASTDDNCVTLG